jgi:superfamily II DNA helicase RecQ
MSRYGELTTCRRKYLLNYFDETAPEYCSNCDICLSQLELYDGTAIVKILITAITDLKEKFGTGYIIDFLRGSASSKIPDDQKALKTYGSGKQTRKEEWHRIIQDLVARGYLLKTPGMYPVLKITEIGQKILHGFEKVMLSRTKEKKFKLEKYERKQPMEHNSETKQQTLKLFFDGYAIEKIALLRGLSQATIEGHMAFYVQQGKISIEQLMDAEKISAIQKVIERLGVKGLTPIVEALGEKYTYAEIRYVIAHIESKLEEPGEIRYERNDSVLLRAA